jgi:hypothetical protein
MRRREGRMGNRPQIANAIAYQYNWKSSKSWAGTCRRLTIDLREGSRLQALFKLK